MTFFDKKQEVMSVELTQYGKYLLSKGKFKPTYYNFIDDDVLYDSEYGKFQENNSDISNRIRNDTPTIKPQYVFSGVETKIKQQIQLSQKIRNNLFISNIQQTPEKQYFLAAPLGNSDLISSTFPAWKINFLKAKIESVNSFRTGSSANNFIPEITIQTSKFKIKAAKTNEDLILQPDEYVSKIFEDSSFIRIIGDSIILELKEENAPVMNSNFDIEFYIQEIDQKTLEEKLTPLYFEQKNQSIVNNILIGDGSENIDLDSTEDPKNVQYYFNINVDSQISDEIKQLLPDSKQTDLQIIPSNNNFIKYPK